MCRELDSQTRIKVLSFLSKESTTNRMDIASEEQENRSLEDVDLEQGMELRDQQEHREEEREAGEGENIQLDPSIHLLKHQADDRDSPEMTTLVTDIPWPPESPVKSRELSSSKHRNERTTTCDICLDEITNRAELEHCQHSYCRDCLAEHCEMSLRQYPILCPHQRCSKRISTRQVQDLLSSRTLFDDYLKHYWLVKSNKYHECPVCCVLLTGGGDADFACVNCQSVSCRIHGRIHTGISCREFRTTDRARSWDETEQTLQQWTKPCSHCGVSLQKSAGCDHIVCVSCQQDMCWKVRTG